MEVRKTPFFPFACTLVKKNLASAAAYRASFLGQVFFMALNNTIFLAFWWLFFQRFQSLGQWRLHDLLALYGMAAFAFGLSAVFFGNAVRLSTFIVNGTLDAYLALPRNPLLHIIMSRMSPAAVGDMIFGFILVFFFTPTSWTKIPLFLVLGLLGAIVFVSFAIIAHSLSFFLGSAEGIGRLLHEAVLTFSLYPESIYSGWVHTLLYTVFPAAFMSHVPVKLLQQLSWSTLLTLVFATAFWAIAAQAFFRYGLSRYESGNLIAPKS